MAACSFINSAASPHQRPYLGGKGFHVFPHLVQRLALAREIDYKVGDDQRFELADIGGDLLRRSIKWPSVVSRRLPQVGPAGGKLR